MLKLNIENKGEVTLPTEILEWEGITLHDIGTIFLLYSVIMGNPSEKVVERYDKLYTTQCVAELARRGIVSVEVDEAGGVHLVLQSPPKDEEDEDY